MSLETTSQAWTDVMSARVLRQVYPVQNEHVVSIASSNNTSAKSDVIKLIMVLTQRILTVFN